MTASSKPDELWDLNGLAMYTCTIRDKMAFAVVDIDAAIEAPSAEHEFFHAVRVQLQHPSESGLMSKEESLAIYEIEDFITELLVDHLRFMYVGRVVTDGHCELHFYGPSEALPPEVRETILDRFPGYEFCGGDGDHDPSWNTYFECLYPNHMAYHYIVLQRTLYGALQKSRPPEEPVSVHHVMYFHSQKGRSAFAETLAGEDVAVRQANVPVDDEHQLVVMHKSPVGLDNIYCFCEKLIDEAKPLGGRYVYCEIDWPEVEYNYLSQDTRLRIAAEAVAGLRSHESLEKFDIHLGEKRQVRPPLN